MPSPDATAVPSYCPSPNVLDDLALMRMGVVGDRFDESPARCQLLAPLDLAEQARRAEALELVDSEGAHAATVRVRDVYTVADTLEPLMGIIGTVDDIAASAPRPFESYYRSPEQAAADIEGDALIVPVTEPLAQLALHEIRRGARGRAIRFLALVGHGTPVRLSAAGLIRASIAAAALLPDAHVVAVPAAARRSQSYNDDFYHHIETAYTTGPSDEMVWPDNHGTLPKSISDAVRPDRPNGLEQGVVVFLTGLSGSGKSTIAQGLQNRIVETGERSVSLLDGDQVRRHLSHGLGFSKEDRETNIQRIGWVAAEIAAHGGLVICSPIAPFDATRKAVRTMAQDKGAAFVLVHVSTPLNECERRDRKGLYAKARRGEIAEFTGISSPYENPDDADMVIDTSGADIDSCVNSIMDLMATHGWISSSGFAVGSGDDDF